MKRRDFLIIGSSAVVSAGMPTQVFAKSRTFKNSWGSAIRGYDPVAYFTQGKPLKGLNDFSYKWNDATWYFTSQENLDLFKASPQKYAPQYGGYCAYAVSQGYTASVDPTAWDIVDGKLYLNYSKSVQKRWKKKRKSYIASANKNWPRVIN